MNIQNAASAATGSACPKKATQLFYVTHPKVPKSLMGPFLNAADAECGRAVMRSAEAQVTASLVDSVDDFTYRRAVSNGQICRAFAGRAAHE